MGYFQKQELGTQWKHLELGTWGFIPGVCVGQVLRSGFIYRLTSLSAEYQKQRKNEETAGKEESKGCCLLCG